jgi:hypothetical protein
MHEHLPELYCPVYQNDPTLAWHLGLSDIGIFIFYIVIPVMLVPFIRLLPRGVANEIKIFGALGALFVVTCGITHLFKPLLLFWNLWDYAVIANWVCFVCSLVAAVYLRWKAMPKFKQFARALKDVAEAKAVDMKAAMETLKSLVTK